MVVSGELSSRGRLQGFVLPGLVIDLDAKDRDLLLRGVAGGADLLSNRLSAVRLPDPRPLTCSDGLFCNRRRRSRSIRIGKEIRTTAMP